MENINWEYVIKERGEWYRIYNTPPISNEPFVQYLRGVAQRYNTPSLPSVVDDILEAYEIYNSMPEEEQVQIALMGW